MEKERLCIRAARAEDIPAITQIYNEYILHSTATFETEVLAEAEMLRRLRDIMPEYPYLVAEVGGEVAGYCYAHPWKERFAYRHTLEATVYLSPDQRGRGMGRQLMERLVATCRTMSGCHALVACITAENEASCALHRKLGFRQVSCFREVGYKFGRWLDVVDYEMLFPEISVPQ